MDHSEPEASAKSSLGFFLNDFMGTLRLRFRFGCFGLKFANDINNGGCFLFVWEQAVDTLCVERCVQLQFGGFGYRQRFLGSH